MRHALRLARRGLGNVWPNPAVGCVVVQGVRVVGRGWTQPGGRPHAERMALDAAGGAARGATAYVTLEPCAQCAGALVLAKVGRIVFGAYDGRCGMAGSVYDLLRHPRLNHRPEVVGGLMAEDCGEILKRFFQSRRATL